MIIATLIALLFLGGKEGFSLKPLMESFAVAVPDQERLDRIEEILAGAKSGIEAFEDQLAGSWSEELMSIHRDQNASRERYEDVFARVDARREALERDLIDRRFAIKDLMSAEEWAVYHAHLEERFQAE